MTVIYKACCKITVDLQKNLKSFTTYSEFPKKSVFLTGEKMYRGKGRLSWSRFETVLTEKRDGLLCAWKLSTSTVVFVFINVKQRDWY